MLLFLLRTWDISLNYSVVSGQLNMTVSGVTLLNIMITEGPTQVRQPVTGMCPSQRRLRARNGQVYCLRAVGRQMHGGEVEGANDGHVDNVLGMVTSSLPRSRCRVHRPRSRTDGRRLCKTWSRFSWRGTRKAARRDRLERPGGWKARRSSTFPLVERSAFPAGHGDRSHQELEHEGRQRSITSLLAPYVHGTVFSPTCTITTSLCCSMRSSGY